MARSTKLIEPKIVFALLCDGVRREVTGQETLVGVYGDSIFTERLPINFGPVLYIRIQFKSQGSYQTEFRFTQNETVLIPEFTFPIVSNDDTLLANVVLGPVPLTIQNTGAIKFSIKIEQGAWLDVYALNVKIGTSPQLALISGQVSTASPPPS